MKDYIDLISGVFLVVGFLFLFFFIPKPKLDVPLYCMNNKIYERYEDKFYKLHYNNKTGLVETCVEIDSK